MTYAPEGNPKTAKIAYIGEAPSTEELLHGVPLVGPSGRVFNALLHQAGLIRGGSYITNLFNCRVFKRWQKPEIYLEEECETLLWSPRAGFTEAALPFRTRLIQELEQCSEANVFVPMGAPAMEAITNKRGITKWRGSILEAERLDKAKTIPTLHPAATIHGPYVWRYYIVSDFCKIKEQSTFRGVHKIPYRFKLTATYDQMISTLRWIKQEKPQVACDTEVDNSYCSLISFAWSDLDCIVVPFDNSWGEVQELNLWELVAAILEDADIAKIFQNSSFDRSFLLNTHKILVRGDIEDTMVKHSLMYPDMQKNLALLTSLHTDQPYYKDLVRIKADAIANKEG